MKEPTLKNQAKALFIGNILGIIFQFLIPSILVRFISQEDFGIYRQFQLIALTFVGTLGMGLQSSLFYFYPISNGSNKAKIIQQTLFLFILILTLFSLLLYFFGDEILIYLNFQDFIDYKWYLYLFITFMIMSSIISIIFTLEKKTRLNKLYPSVEKISNFFIFLIVIQFVTGYEGPILALVLFSLVRLIYFLLYSLPYLRKIFLPSWQRIKEQLVYSIPFGFALILNQISVKFDKFFINQYISPEEFGVYSIAFLGIPVLKQFFTSIHNVVVPEISKFFANGNKVKAIVLWQKTVDRTSSVTIPAVTLFWLMANEIITILYTKAYIEAANYYRVFILMFLVSMFSHELILRGANKTKYIFISNVIGSIVTILLGFWLIPKYGLYGAIVTALIGTITPMLISLHIERKVMKLEFKNWVNWNNIFTNVSICLVVFIPLFLFKDRVSNIYLRLISCSILFLFTVIILQIKFKIFIFKKYIPHITKFIKI